MPSWIIEHDRIIKNIAVPIPRLAVGQIGHYRIGLGEAAQRGGVESGVVIHQADHCIIPLSSITKSGFRDGIVPAQGAHFAKGQIPLCAFNRGCLILARNSWCPISHSV